jgi:hypothetical protein
LFRSLSPLSGNRQQLKANLMTRFMVTLSLHPEYVRLCRIIQDPQYFGMGNHPIQVFFVVFRHNITQVNLKLLNHSILLFSINLIKKDYVGTDLTNEKTFCMAQYESTTTAMWIRTILGVFAEHGVPFNMGSFNFTGKFSYCHLFFILYSFISYFLSSIIKYSPHFFLGCSICFKFNASGSFLCYWSSIFSQCIVPRPEFGTRSNAATFDPAADAKIDQAITKGLFDRINNYLHHTDLLQVRVMEHLGLQGEEVNLMSWNDWYRSEMDDGEFTGVKTWQCKSSNNGQKGQGLTLWNNTRTTSNSDTSYTPVLESMNRLSLYQLIDNHFEYMPPNCEPSDRMFRRGASNKILKVCLSGY